ncbi:cytochrome d ubiquinol oxidase subunit II [Phytohabitans rumicis]|uniref:Cytochrome D ubiquinol oxidase subunit II n=1 Tax=Phytohabitans rumicis TaxID=1076125 RepID=A0A6V8LN68_9ACTN|nr:cytochrome d ubiquinol oxidase subunit II [Phytohabitans rumicis]GFJ95527.1 cytochrome D ubiquinol oxidase subunit II [Phytohabitans rumicis]
MTTVWFGLILLCLLMYVVLDGYDLGIGIATLAERDARYRHEMLEQVAQAWDGNETWLVLLAVALWAGFPAAFGTILPHAYLPLIVMLFSLVVRGVSVEMASQSHPAPRWETAFGVASLTAALSQGAAAGTLTGAIGGFSALSALTVTCGYLALGYAYTKWKTTGRLRARAGRRGTITAVLATVLAAACLVAVNVTAAPPHLHDPARTVAAGGLLLIAAAGVAATLATLRRGSPHDGLPLVGLVTAVVTVAIALVVTRYPALTPDLTLADAAAPHHTMAFLAVGIGLNVPLILYYTWFAHHTFHGKLGGTHGN